VVQTRSGGSGKKQQGMDINAVLSVEGKEEVYVGSATKSWIDGFHRPGDYPFFLHICASYRSIEDLVVVLYLYSPSDALSGMSCTPITPSWTYAVRLNSRAGVFALSLATWHGMRIVSRHHRREQA